MKFSVSYEGQPPGPSTEGSVQAGLMGGSNDVCAHLVGHFVPLTLVQPEVRLAEKDWGTRADK